MVSTNGVSSSFDFKRDSQNKSSWLSVQQVATMMMMMTVVAMNAFKCEEKE